MVFRLTATQRGAPTLNEGDRNYVRIHLAQESPEDGSPEGSIPISPARSQSLSATPGMGEIPSALAKPPDDEAAHASPVYAHPKHADDDQGKLLAWFTRRE